MTTSKTSTNKRLDALRTAALGIALIWACWITSNGLSAGLRQGMPFFQIVMHTTFPGLVFLVGVLVAWRWALVGGILLLVEGAVSVLFYPFFVAIPALAAGILLLAWRINK